MSKTCMVCDRRPHMGYQLSHSHRRTKKRWNLNLQRKRVLIDGKPVRGYVCARCLGSGKAEAYIKPPRPAEATA